MEAPQQNEHKHEENSTISKDYMCFLWFTLMYFAYTYTPDRSKHIRPFFLSFFMMLPCADCAQDALLDLQEHPIRPDMSRDELIAYVVEFHNRVNVKLGKPNAIWTVSKAIRVLKRWLAIQPAIAKMARESEESKQSTPNGAADPTQDILATLVPTAKTNKKEEMDPVRQRPRTAVPLGVTRIRVAFENTQNVVQQAATVAGLPLADLQKLGLLAVATVGFAVFFVVRNRSASKNDNARF